MLMKKDFSGLAKRFGYALAYDRSPAAALEEDFLRALASPYKMVSTADPEIVVKYFKPNSTGLFAVVECTVAVADGAAVLLDLIVTGTGRKKYICVEGISGTAGEP